jgi:hypothetical protein
MATLRPCEAARPNCSRIVGGGGDCSPSSVSEPIRNYSIAGYFSRMLIEYSAIVKACQEISHGFGWSVEFRTLRRLRNPCLLTNFLILYNIDRLWDL